MNHSAVINRPLYRIKSSYRNLVCVILLNKSRNIDSFKKSQITQLKINNQRQYRRLLCNDLSY